jgi:Carboxypeptidase regulatory-like domain
VRLGAIVCPTPDFPSFLRPRLIINHAILGPSPRAPRRSNVVRGFLAASLLAFASGLIAPGLSAQSSGANPPPPDPSSSHAGSAPSGPTPSGPAPSGPASAGIVQGVVAGKDGEVYEGVRVELARPLTGSETQPPLVQETDSEGEFTFVNVPAGAFTLTVSSDGFATQTISGALKPGETFDAQTIVLLMKEASTEVHVSALQQEEIAEEQIHFEETQRVLGVLPNFYVSYDRNPVPLTTRQKYALAWRSNIDPFTLLINGAFAGIEQAENTFAGYGQGMQGYGKRFGANYADTFISTEIGGAVLPSLFKQDPRYFYKGTGTIRARTGYAIANAVICKGDNMHWQFNYSGILGGLAAGGISNLYYPASDRGSVAFTFENAALGIGESAVQNVFQEFIVKKLTPAARKVASQ